MKFVSLFFDKEQFGGTSISPFWKATPWRLLRRTWRRASWRVCPRKRHAFLKKDGLVFGEILHDTFRTSLCVDAGMLAYQGEAGVLKKAFAIDTQLI